MTNQPIEEKWKETFVEAGANIEHDRWARWQKHLHSKLKYWEFDKSKGGNKMAMYVLDPADYERWSRQIDTPYSELSESEKESDREESRNYLPLIENLLEQERSRISDEIIKAIGASKLGILKNKTTLEVLKDILSIINPSKE